MVSPLSPNFVALCSALNEPFWSCSIKSSVSSFPYPSASQYSRISSLSWSYALLASFCASFDFSHWSNCFPRSEDQFTSAPFPISDKIGWSLIHLSSISWYLSRESLVSLMDCLYASWVSVYFPSDSINPLLAASNFCCLFCCCAKSNKSVVEKLVLPVVSSIVRFRSE